jgi:peptidoglycan/LPS O-acetylase OafA/YrhL
MARGRLSAIEAGRGVAATAVVLYHTARHVAQGRPAPWLTHVFQFGHAGVDFFFVISGFIILHVHRPDIGRPTRVRHYAARRFTRVFPAYWVALVLTVLLGLGGHFHRMPSAGDFLTSVILLPAHRAPLLGIAWTLQYEIFFYAVFSVLILNRTAGIAALIAWLGWIGLGIAGVAGRLLPPSLSGTYNLEFFAGMLAAHVLATHTLRAPLWWLGAGVAGFAGAAVAEDLGWLDGYADTARLAYGIPAALIVAGGAALEREDAISVPGLLRALGTASYSIYLFQFIFIGLVWQLLSAAGASGRMPAAASFAVLAVAGVAGGVAMSRWVEYPLMQRFRSL